MGLRAESFFEYERNPKADQEGCPVLLAGVDNAMHIQFINVVGGDFSAMDIGITQLATYINQRTSHRASILDMTFHRRHWKEHLRYGFETHRPDMYGISTNSMYMQFIKPVLAEIKAVYGLPVILGGAHASIHPENVFRLPEVDALCIGDGEFALTRYLDTLSNGTSAEGIPGIWAKEKGEEIRNPGGSFVENIDQFPYPDWGLWEDLEKYFYFLGMLYIQGSRGCPYKCTYCDAHGIAEAVAGNFFRLCDPVKFAGEIAYQWNRFKGLKNPPRLAQLFDPVFTISMEWLQAFCDEYRRLGLHKELRYSAFTRIDHLNEEKIKLLAESGCAILRPGIETGDDDIRQRVYKKSTTTAQIREVVRLCRKHGIALTAFYMLGGPGESRETMQCTIDLAVEIDASRSAFFIYKPFTKEAEQQVREFGGEIDTTLWEEADNITFGAVVKLAGVPLMAIEGYQRKAYFLTFGRRLLRMVRRQKLSYFTRLFIYMVKGLRLGLDWRYLITYYHIYSYDNVDK
jgi:radical SAM superfamily enzyme YgiQ (UPF0313 family)